MKFYVNLIFDVSGFLPTICLFINPI